MTKLCRVGVLISGSGSNLQALIDASTQHGYGANIAVVISNKADAYGVTRAKYAGIPVEVISHTDYASRDAFDTAMDVVLKAYDVDVVCLAGFMRLLSDGFVTRWRDKLMNIHPSLLPAFKGVDVHERVLQAGAKLSGCTVHFVRSEMDVGPIIIQAAVPVYGDDTPDTLAQRVHAQEHQIYPQALAWFAKGALSITDERVRIMGEKKGADRLICPSS